MKALLFKDISDTYTEVEVFVGLKIRENFLDKDLTKYVILVNGTLKTPDHVIQEKDIIVIRKIPTASVVIGLAYVVGFGALTLGVFSVIALAHNANETRKQVAALQDKIKNMSLKDSVANIPYLKGANNSVAKGKSQPYIIGEHLFTPYLLTQSFSTIANAGGRDQYLHIVLESGFNKQVLRNLKSDDVIIKTWENSLTTPQEGLYRFDAGSVFASPDSVIEIRQNGNEFSTPAFNQKRITQETGEELRKADDERYEPLYFTLAENTMSADVCILFNGLRAYDKETGDKKVRTVVVNAEYKIQGGSWTSFPFLINGSPTNTFSGNTSSQLRYNAHIDFSYAGIKNITEPIQIRLSTPTNKYDGSAYDSVYVQWVQSVIYNPDASRTAGYFIPEKIIEQNERNLSTLIGLKIKATQSNQEKLSKINIVTAGVARTWNGSEWSPSKVPTRNPASWLLEVLTSPTHTASQCSDSEIDLDSLGELYEYCETENYKIDMAIIEGDTKTNLLSTILETCNAMLYEDIYGQKSVAIDKEKPNAIAVINTQNCISFSVEKSLARQTDGFRMKYISRVGGYDTNTYLVMKEGKTRNSESIIRDINVTGITEHEHIVKNARRMMAIETLRPKSVKIKIGKEGQYFPPLSKVLVQHPALKIGLGSAEIKSVIVSGSYIIGLELYDAIERSESLTGYGMVIQCVSSTYSTPLAVAYRAIEDNPKEISFTIPLSVSAPVVPRAGNILSYGLLNSGNFDTITSPMLIIGAEPDTDGFNLTLTDYNTNIYSTGTIPEYTPNMTDRITPVSVPETISPATLDDVSNAMATVVSGVDVSEPDDILSLVATAQRDYINVNWEWDGVSINNSVKRFIVECSVDSGVTWRELSEPTTNQVVYYFDRATDGYPEKTTGTYSLDKWRFRVKAENIYGKVSLGYSPIASVDVSQYKTWIPPKPVIQVLTAIESGFEFAASYDDASFYGSGKRLEFYVEGVKKEERGGIILFNRSVDGYPETVASRAYHNITTGKALDNFAVRAKLITDENSGTLGDVKTPNVQYYKTWIPRLPSLALSVAGRKISLSIIPTNEVYGSIENRIQIRRYDEASYFALGNDDDAYTNETAYKQGAVNSYTPTFFNNYDQAVPLENQAAELPIDTSYYYRIQSRQSGFSDPVYTTAWTAAKLAIAKATSIRDITANSIKQAQLANKAVTNRTIDDLAVDTDQLAIGAVVADRIASRTITAEQLSVVARSKINSFIHESDGLTGWTTGGEIVTVGSERALKLSSPGPSFLSDPFDVQPDELLEFSFGLQCSREAEEGKGLYIGLTYGDTYESFVYSWTDKKWNFSGVNTNAYFVDDYRSSTKKFFKTYILGYNIDITTVPSPQFTDESYSVRCLKLSSGKTQTRIRSGYNAITTPTFWYLFSPQVYQVGAGKIVAQQIDVKNLSAMSSKLGEIQGDTADYKIVMGSGGSAEEGTFLLGKAGEDHIRRYKKNNDWVLSIETSTFIVDSVASKIIGDFAVVKKGDLDNYILHMNIDETGINHLLTVRSNTTITKNLTVSEKITSGASNVDSCDGWNIGYEIQSAGHGAIRWIDSNDNKGWMIGFHSNGNMYFARLQSKTTGTYPVTFSEGGNINASSLSIGSATISSAGAITGSSLNVGIGSVQAELYRYTPKKYTKGFGGVQFTQFSGAEDNPTTDWYSHIVLHHADNHGYYIDIASCFHSDSTYIRRMTNGTISSWRKIVFQGDAIFATTPPTAANNTQVATTAFVKNQKYEPNRGTGINSTALGATPIASGDYSTALGVNSAASGTYSIALGAYAEATIPYQITIGTKFVYLRFASTETEATVYAALSPWVNPSAGDSQGAMGSFGTQEITRLHRLNSTTIELFDNRNALVKKIYSGNGDQIGSEFAICTVKY